MILLDQVTLTATVRINVMRAEVRTVISSASLAIPSDRRIALLGPSDEDKKVLINLLGGVVLPRKGRILKKAKVSFPVGYLGGFTVDFSPRKNVAHLARLYDADVETVVDFVENTTVLGPAFDKPYKLLTGPQRRQLGRVVGYSIPFDVYVLTEEIVNGRNKENDISYHLFQARSRTAGMIIPTQNPKFAREHCEMGLVLNDGDLRFFDSIENAIAAMQ
jgi:capsular polysaccharide transport system ATP-binding protein